MTRLVQMTPELARRLHQTRSGGSALLFRFLPPGPNDRNQKWSLDSVEGILRSLPHPRHAKSYEIWVTSTEINLVAWSQDQEDAWRLLRHWQNFNPAIQQQEAPYPFPPIRPGSRIRVAHLRPRRAARHPIETRFGQQGIELVTSPIVHLLNNLPTLPDGSTLILQFTWKQNRVPWRWSPFAYMDFKPGLGRDDEALHEKKQHRITYYADIRIAEIHANCVDVNYTRAVADALHVYHRDHANRLLLKRRMHWTRRRITCFLAAMKRRDLTVFHHSMWHRPRYTLTELACLAHPPPPGSVVSDLAASNVRPIEASGGTTLQGQALRNLVTDQQRAHHGTNRKLKASDVTAHRRRSRP